MPSRLPPTKGGRIESVPQRDSFQPLVPPQPTRVSSDVYTIWGATRRALSCCSYWSCCPLSFYIFPLRHGQSICSGCGGGHGHGHGHGCGCDCDCGWGCASCGSGSCACGSASACHRRGCRHLAGRRRGPRRHLRSCGHRRSRRRLRKREEVRHRHHRRRGRSGSGRPGCNCRGGSRRTSPGCLLLLLLRHRRKSRRRRRHRKSCRRRRRRMRILRPCYLLPCLGPWAEGRSCLRPWMLGARSQGRRGCRSRVQAGNSGRSAQAGGRHGTRGRWAAAEAHSWPTLRSRG
mmetsp:Transcript_136282/g.436068  ORF Transcript_136282/g.436068 Transcript_136282/m.436068 type:complete len:289 (-) Transcript_136282:1368-2234(-)